MKRVRDGGVKLRLAHSAAREIPKGPLARYHYVPSPENTVTNLPKTSVRFTFLFVPELHGTGVTFF